ncbi:MAG: riboflavin biosynthesis protein RibF [Bacilli bacterium]|nr:riboflavin biosynthesis protein RibF [Bacilli bacterium]
MDVFEFDYRSFPSLDGDIVLCLGFFDGVHLGHQKIINEAKKLGKKVAVLSFSNSAYNFLNGSTELLTPTYVKIQLLQQLNVDYYLEIEMSEALIKASAEDFLNQIKTLKPSVCVCGADYTFGYNKQGDVDLLSKYFITKVIPYEMFDDEKISSRWIFDALSKGKITLANRLLGRHYTVRGRVVKGLQNGARLGYPTANLALYDSYFMPREGVYFGIAKLYEEEYNAIASFGTHPTIDELEAPILEIFLLDFNEDIYGERMEFEFLDFVRENYKFENNFELSNQLYVDKLAAKDFFSKKVD